MARCGPFPRRARRARAQTTPGVTAARATVYIRLLGDLEVVRPADPLSPERRMEASDVELSTGSGVLISPLGYVLTAAHVVSAENGKLTLNGVRVEVKQTVRHIEVLLPPDESGGPSPTPLDATILAIDPALDLAVLSVGGGNLPFLDLGDSDGLAIGDPVEAIGFPFGDQVEIGRPRTALTGAPAPSVSRGNLAAFRGDDQGDRRFLQLTASLNPGNSGGPVVDADGYLVAVANSVMRSRGGVGAGVGFGVSVNLVKRFLEGHGFDSALRARRMTAGSLTSLEGKAIRVALPIGMSDTSPFRTRVDTGGQSVDGVTLRIDRVLSAWPAVRIAESLTAGRGFESFAAATPPPPSDAGGGRLFLGRATGTQADGTPVRLEYRGRPGWRGEGRRAVRRSAAPVGLQRLDRPRGTQDDRGGSVAGAGARPGCTRSLGAESGAARQRARSRAASGGVDHRARGAAGVCRRAAAGRRRVRVAGRRFHRVAAGRLDHGGRDGAAAGGRGVRDAGRRRPVDIRTRVCVPWNAVRRPGPVRRRRRRRTRPAGMVGAGRPGGGGAHAVRSLARQMIPSPSCRRS